MSRQLEIRGDIENSLTDTLPFVIINDDGNWVTVNGARIPKGEDGELKGEVGEKVMQTQENQEHNGAKMSSEYSATGANPNLPGFSQKNLDNHFGSGLPSDHSAQYVGLTKEQYAQRAVELARSPVGEGVEGYVATYVRFKGSVVRYDTSSNDWVRVAPNGIATMFKPEDSARYFELINQIETRGD